LDATAQAFDAGIRGRRDLSKWLLNRALPEAGLTLKLQAELGGRYTQHVYLPRFDVSGGAAELFTFGAVAWAHAAQFDAQGCYFVHLGKAPTRAFDAIALCGYVSDKERRAGRYHAVPSPVVIPRSPPMHGYSSDRASVPSFGVFERGHLGYGDPLGGATVQPRKAVVITGSRTALRLLGKWLMQFALRDAEELSFSHGGGRPEVGVFSYEMRFRKMPL
jgi:hypothetical protein